MQQVVTHSGKFHADDVLSWGLLQQFYPYSMTITRTRKQIIIEKADIVFDVGGLYDPSLGRFDHHQNEYQGKYSSAGMLLDWLEKESYVSEKIALILRERLVDYVDDVDNGRVETSKSLPCFATIVDLFNRSANSLEEFDQQFLKAASLAKTLIENIILEVETLERSSSIVKEEMKRTLESGYNILELPYYLPWKPAYFANKGSSHPTEFVLFPTLEQTWQVVAIPPIEESFAQKRSFPESWAGLRDADLTAITGEEAIFCHKNLFIAVFKTKKAAVSAMKRFDLLNT